MIHDNVKVTDVNGKTGIVVGTSFTGYGWKLLVRVQDAHTKVWDYESTGGPKDQYHPEEYQTWSLDQVAGAHSSYLVGPDD